MASLESILESTELRSSPAPIPDDESSRASTPFPLDPALASLSGNATNNVPVQTGSTTVTPAKRRQNQMQYLAVEAESKKLKLSGIKKLEKWIAVSDLHPVHEPGMIYHSITRLLMSSAKS